MMRKVELVLSSAAKHCEKRNSLQKNGKNGVVVGGFSMNGLQVSAPALKTVRSSTTRENICEVSYKMNEEGKNSSLSKLRGRGSL